MKYKVLGKTGVMVSELCFGTMTFGNEADETESKKLFRRCREAGINFFDCANNYSDGRAEKILGKLIHDCRDDVVVTTKVTNRIGPDVNALGSSRRHIMMEVEKSLSRLNTDRIDLYFLHYFDPQCAVDETLRALDDLVRQGKVLYIGASNWAAWQSATALGISAKKGLARFECLQPMYNLVKRQAEVEILPLAAAENLGVIVYSPMAGGLLSGKYVTDPALQQGRIVEKSLYTERYSVPEYHDTTHRFVTYAQQKDIHPATLAIAWVKAHPAVTAPIIGARNVAQLETSLAAADLDLNPEDRGDISGLSITPPNATDRLEEIINPKYGLRQR